MAFEWQDIYEGETGQSVADKINAAMAAILDWFGDPEVDQSLWFLETGMTHIRPKEDRDVHMIVMAATEGYIDFLETSDRFTANGEIFFPDLAPESGKHVLYVDSNGLVTIHDPEMDEGQVQQGHGTVYLQSSSHSVSIDSPNILCYFNGNTDVHLPNARFAQTVEVVVRKCKDDAYAVAIHKGIENIIMGGSSGHTLETTEYGAWIRLKAVTVVDGESISSNFYVLEHGGTWTLDSSE